MTLLLNTSNNLNNPVHPSLKRLSSNTELRSINLNKNMKKPSQSPKESFKKQLTHQNKTSNKWDQCLKLTSRIFLRESRKKKTRLKDTSTPRLKNGSQDFEMSSNNMKSSSKCSKTSSKNKRRRHRRLFRILNMTLILKSKRFQPLSNIFEKQRSRWTQRSNRTTSKWSFTWRSSMLSGRSKWLRMKTLRVNWLKKNER